MAPARRNKIFRQLLVLGHYDTVYATGTLSKNALPRLRPKNFGPGVFDMKAGIVQALFALDALLATHAPVRKQIVSSGPLTKKLASESSRKLLETEAAHSDAVFVLEPSLGPRGLLKTARKGVGEAQLTVQGKARMLVSRRKKASTPFTKWR